MARKANQGRQPTRERAGVPGAPRTASGGPVAIAPELFEIVFQDVDDEEGAIRGQEFAQPHALGARAQRGAIAEQEPAGALDDAARDFGAQALVIALRALQAI